ncbi:MAG: hypothetical protein GPOALKHO_001724 [Sodalis sp.]|nr:MAG: hypothetical protein GPOALKHO_001724 [Sodalis sp.]
MAEQFEWWSSAAGAAGMSCAAQAQLGRRMLLLYNGKTSRKILISVGGRCNLNLYIAMAASLPQNPHFPLYAMGFHLVQRHGVA